MKKSAILSELCYVLRMEALHGSDYDRLYFGIQDIIDKITDVKEE